MCYDLAGKANPNDVPCNSGGESLCCGPTSPCLANNVCFYPEANILSRGVSLSLLSTYSDHPLTYLPHRPAPIAVGQVKPARSSLSTAVAGRYATERVKPALPGWRDMADRFRGQGVNSIISICEGGLWDQSAYCISDGYPCDKQADRNLFQLAPGWLSDTRSLKASGTTDNLQPNSTTVTCSTSPATPSSSSIQSSVLPCTSSKQAKVGIGAGLGIPLAAVAGGAIYWALRERRLRKRAERSPPRYTQDFGGIADTMK